MSFRALVRARQMNERGALGNPLIAEALVEGHFAVQTLAIRRLMDTKRTGVISLVKLLKDIEANIKLFTRENFVAFDGLPYDYASAQQRTEAWPAAHDGAVWMSSDGPYAWSSAAHEIFDCLSGIDASKRQRQDCIPKKHVKTLQRWLAKSDADSIVEWTHNFLAHAAVRNSHGRVALTSIRPTVDKITAVSRTFVRVLEAISAYLLYDSKFGAITPVPQYDLFEGLSTPAIAMEQVFDLQSRWDTLAKERDDFLHGVLENMLAG